MSDFIKCSKGHVYDSKKEKECPYCSGKKIEDDLENLPSDDGYLPESAMCYDMGPGIDMDSPDNKDKW